MLSVFKNQYQGCTVKGLPILKPFVAPIKDPSRPLESSVGCFILVPCEEDDREEKAPDAIRLDQIKHEPSVELNSNMCPELDIPSQIPTTDTGQANNVPYDRHSFPPEVVVENVKQNGNIIVEEPDTGNMSDADLSSDSSPGTCVAQQTLNLAELVVEHGLYQNEHKEIGTQPPDTENVVDHRYNFRRNRQKSRRLYNENISTDWRDSDDDTSSANETAEVTAVKADSDYICSSDDNSNVIVESEKKTNKKKKVEKVESKVEEKPWVSITLEEHMDKYKMDTYVSMQQKHRGTEVRESLYLCLVCNIYKVSDKTAFKDHIEQHVNGVLRCKICGFEASGQFAYRRHQMDCHGIHTRKTFVCHLCGVLKSCTFTSHMREVHNVKPLQCRFCDKHFWKLWDRKVHYKESHVSESKFCRNCEHFLSSMTDSEYEEHVASCPSHIQCDLCGAVLQNKKILIQQHKERRHTGSRNHSCKFCPFSAKSSGTLQRHLKIHEGRHPYQCDQCSFSCVQSGQLKSHMKTHTGEKPFKCDKCTYAAAWNVQLKDHIKVHELSTALTCGNCGVVLKNDFALKKHMKKEHSQ